MFRNKTFIGAQNINSNHSYHIFFFLRKDNNSEVQILKKMLVIVRTTSNFVISVSLLLYLLEL